METMKNSYLMIIAFLISTVTFAQTEKIIKGKVMAGKIPVENVEVINISNQRAAMTNAKGEFEILAKPNDPLIYNNSNYEGIRKRLLKADYDAGKVTVSIVPIATNLDEVVITKDDGTTGLEASKRFTTAERRLETGNRQLRLNQGLEISNDAIINKISGKSKRLRKEVEVERKEAFIQELSDTFEDEFFTNDLKIDKDYVEGFKFFLAEDSEFRKSFHGASDQAFGALLLQKTDQYMQVIANEK